MLPLLLIKNLCYATHSSNPNRPNQHTALYCISSAEERPPMTPSTTTNQLQFAQPVLPKSNILNFFKYSCEPAQTEADINKETNTSAALLDHIF
jgi:hypothetical protein